MIEAHVAFGSNNLTSQADGVERLLVLVAGKVERPVP
jgi:hypothetical protein